MEKDQPVRVCLAVCGHAGKHISVLLSADGSIVIGLSVSDLFPAFVLQAFCRLTHGQKRKGTRGRTEKEEKMEDVCKSTCMADSLH